MKTKREQILDAVFAPLEPPTPIISKRPTLLARIWRRIFGDPAYIRYTDSFTEPMPDGTMLHYTRFFREAIGETKFREWLDFHRDKIKNHCEICGEDHTFKNLGKHLNNRHNHAGTGKTKNTG